MLPPVSDGTQMPRYPLDPVSRRRCRAEGPAAPVLPESSPRAVRCDHPGTSAEGLVNPQEHLARSDRHHRVPATRKGAGAPIDALDLGGISRVHGRADRYVPVASVRRGLELTARRSVLRSWRLGSAAPCPAWPAGWTRSSLRSSRPGITCRRSVDWSVPRRPDRGSAVLEG